jgi:hypothetical protein
VLLVHLHREIVQRAQEEVALGGERGREQGVGDWRRRLLKRGAAASFFWGFVTFFSVGCCCFLHRRTIDTTADAQRKKVQLGLEEQGAGVDRLWVCTPLHTA